MATTDISSGTFKPIEFIADIADGLSAATYYVQDGEAMQADGFVATKEYCENAYVRLQFNNDGTFDLLNKANGAVYKNQNRFELTPDCGNEYDFKPDGETRIISNDTATVALVEFNPLKAVYEIGVEIGRAHV